MVHVLCINPFKSSVMFRIATSHLFCSAKQMVSIWNAILGWNGLKAFAIIHYRSTPDFECALNVAKTTLHLLENHSNFQDCNILECWFGIFQLFLGNTTWNLLKFGKGNSREMSYETISSLFYDWFSSTKLILQQKIKIHFSACWGNTPG